MKRHVMRGLAYAILIYLGVCSYMFTMQRSFMYHPTTEKPVLADAMLPGFTEITLKTSDGIDLVAWEAKADLGKPTILFLHGNAGILSKNATKVRELHRLGYGILQLAWRGFSGNQGSPTEDGLYTDAFTGLKYVREVMKVEPRDIVVYGESLGTGIATEVARKMAQEGAPARALVLYAPYTTLSAVGAIEYWYLPVDFLTWDKYETIKKIDQVNTPVLVLHGTQDETIPLDQARQLYEAAKDPKQMRVFEGGRHNDLFDYGAANTIDEFLRGV